MNVVSAVGRGAKNIPDEIARIELDSHAMSPVVGYNAYVYRDTGQTIDVAPFVSTLGKLNKIPIVDAMVHYQCPFTHKDYILLIHNALYVAELQHSLVPPFLILESGVILNECPKIQCNAPMHDNHSLYFEEDDLRIHMGLQGTFSYFTTKYLTKEEIANLTRMSLTPERDKWNPHDDYYSRCEESMLDFEGNIIDKAFRDKFFFDFSKDYDDSMFETSGIEVLEDILPDVVDE